MDLENFDSKCARREDPERFKDIDFEMLLGKYGPEGLYELADKLKKIADNDVYEALNNL